MGVRLAAKILTISEIIDDLQKWKAKHGDMMVVVQYEGMTVSALTFYRGDPERIADSSIDVQSSEPVLIIDAYAEFYRGQLEHPADR